jgi:hypothetical protein
MWGKCYVREVPAENLDPVVSGAQVATGICSSVT